jgi:hypothetical protein
MPDTPWFPMECQTMENQGVIETMHLEREVIDVYVMRSKNDSAY